MKKILLLVLMVLSAVACSTVKKAPPKNNMQLKVIADSILSEGMFLYRLEKASWHSSDDFNANYKELLNSFKGYFSYEVPGDAVYSVFYDQSSPAKVLVRYRFTNLPKSTELTADTKHPDMNAIEKDLMALREEAMRRIIEDKDTVFRFYKDTRFNFIPIVRNGEKKVVVLTGPTKNEVLIGNDYELFFDESNRLTSKRRIHNAMINLTEQRKKSNIEVKYSGHNHVFSDYIDATDICTLLLYKFMLVEDEHIVLSEKYVSLFNIKDQTLTIIPREIFEIMGKANK